VVNNNNTNQSQVAGDHAVLIQAGRDITLAVLRGPPDVKLVKLTIENDDCDAGRRQKMGVILKNNGDRSAVLLSGHLIVEGKVVIRNCNEMYTHYSLIESDWTYDVDLEAADPSFIGRHSLEPNEVINFHVAAARKEGSQEITVYRCHLKLAFDEGDDLETGHFFFEISGPTQVMGSFTARDPSPEQWGSAWRITSNG
jgi:hypothetical protein